MPIQSHIAVISCTEGFTAQFGRHVGLECRANASSFKLIKERMSENLSLHVGDNIDSRT